MKKVLKIPELPEVETIVRDLQPIIGHKIVFNKAFPKIHSISKTALYDLTGLIIEKVERYGKYIIIKFEKSAYLIHLGMSGRLIIEEGHELIPDHIHWLIQLDNGQQLRYIDVRRFGNLWNMTYKECIDYVQARVGPEPFDLEPDNFIIRIRQDIYLNKPVKVVILDQKLIAGIGNIYASEACHEAYINPKTLVKDLSNNQLEHLLYASRKVLERGIKNNGTTFKDFRNGKNQKGNNQNFLGVYKQNICKRCNSKITKETVEGRSTFWCENCLRE